MRFEETAPVVIGETRKVAPCPEAARNVAAIPALGILTGAVTAGAVGIVVLAMGWHIEVIAVAAGLGTLIGLAIGLGRFDDLTLSVEEVTEYAPPMQPVVQQAVNWEIPVGPHQIERGTLIASPALVIEWARAVASQQSLSYATWGERFGGERKYASFRKRLVDSGLAIEQGKELAITRKGWALFTQIAERGDGATPLLEKHPLLQASRDSEIHR